VTRRATYLGLGLALAVLATACGGPVERPPGGATPSEPGSSPPTTAVPAEFVGEVGPVSAAEVAASWRPGCPVRPDQLRRLRLSHWDFAGRIRVGELIVHESVSGGVVDVFRRLFEQRFPIRRMEPVDRYGGSDDASMAADNTSGFNCREAVAQGRATWSQHAYGRAVDVNPVENPYLLAGRVLPPTGAAYVDRIRHRPGMAVPGGVLVEAFTAAGWRWGGNWRTSPDYQHFDTTTR
jgi:hypothetical protein